MEQLINFYYRLLERYSEFTQMRYLYDEINWENPLILIRGPKGSGKTTMLMQHILRTFPDKSKGFGQIANIPNSYVVADGIDMGFENKIPLWMFGLLY